LKACFTEKSEIQVWSNHSKKKILEPYGADYKHTNDNRTYFILEPGYRAMIPTGLIFDIPSGYSLRAHPRSGLAIKQGLTLINSMAIVDEDFINETMVLLVNTSSELCEIHDGDRIAQAELVRQLQYTMTETNDAPQQKTSRIDGFGSTGI
jgi:dUTP pyrophosphatase